MLRIMTSTFTKLILLSLILLTLLGCAKNNDSPETGDFRHEAIFSDVAGEEVIITYDGMELACKRVGDLYIFQDDIVFTADQVEQGAGLKGTGITAETYYWEFATVYYSIEDGFPEVDRIHAAIAHWEENTSMSFVERTVEDNYVEFVESDGTASRLGMVGGKQKIRVADWATAGNVIHEIGHAVGLYHEHSKPNRDDYILILPENFAPGVSRNFYKLDQALFTEGFDFASIMLYSSLAGSGNGQPCITRLDGTNYEAQREYLSPSDIEIIKRMYEDFDCFDCLRGQVTDIDVNTYATVKIGDQWWMAENLATTRLNDGTAILELSDNSSWISNTSGAYCWYENDQESYKQSYGALYNYYIVENDKLCPDGWHVPYDFEWQELEQFLGMSESESAEFGRRGTDEGGKLKAEGNTNWYEPNTGATNESGFTALPGGYRYYSDGDFYELGSAGYFWGVELMENGDVRPVYRELGSSHSAIARQRPWEESGYSVRCIRD